MSLRETINKNAKAATLIGMGLLTVAAVAIGVQVWSMISPSATPPVQGLAFYSDDDGITWYKDDINKAPPYVNDKGKEAVWARVFKCPDGKLFVGYLERYTAEAKKVIDDPSGPSPEKENMKASGREVKKPGPKARWLNIRDSYDQAILVRQVICPDGSAAEEELTVAIDLSPKRK